MGSRGQRGLGISSARRCHQATPQVCVWRPPTAPSPVRGLRRARRYVLDQFFAKLALGIRSDCAGVIQAWKGGAPAAMGVRRPHAGLWRDMASHNVKVFSHTLRHTKAHRALGAADSQEETEILANDWADRLAKEAAARHALTQEEVARHAKAAKLWATIAKGAAKLLQLWPPPSAFFGKGLHRAAPTKFPQTARPP